jgi:hypothetical protein
MWQHELDIPGHKFEQMTSLIYSGDYVFCSVSNDQGGAIFKIEMENPLLQQSTNTFVSWMWGDKSRIFSKEDCWLKNRNQQSCSVESEKCLQLAPNWPATSPVSVLLSQHLYLADGQNIAKFDSQGNLVYNKILVPSAMPKILKAGSSFLYLYAILPNNQACLVQFDSIGVERWRVYQDYVENLVVDSEDNCFAILPSNNFETKIVKYDKNGLVQWEQGTTGQYTRNGYIRGDSLFLCGNSSDATIGPASALSIFSSLTGKTKLRQTVDIYEDKNMSEGFLYILADDNFIYAGGIRGDENPIAYIVKIDLGNSLPTGKAEIKNGKFFNIFPNPSKNRFTVVYDNNNSKDIFITIRNSNGQILEKYEQHNESATSKELDLSHYPSGVYSVEVTFGKEKKVKQIIVE